jgi:hypothetical protein
MDFGFLGRRKVPTLLFGLLFCVFGTAFSLYSCIKLHHAYRLRDTVDKVDGRIERAYISHGSKGGTSYHVTYSYVVGNETVSVQGATISQDAWPVVFVGEAITVRYLGDDPTISEPDFPGEVDFAIRQGWIGTLIPLLFVGVGFYTALFSPKGKKDYGSSRQFDGFR